MFYCENCRFATMIFYSFDQKFIQSPLHLKETGLIFSQLFNMRILWIILPLPFEK